MEKLMQFVWQHRLWTEQSLTTVDGRRLRIIDPGKINTDSGPDFFNAKVAIDGHIWAGDIEIHVKASDWHRHGHDGDPAYDSVILHVVDRDDTIIRRSNGEYIPQMRMPCEPRFYYSYSELVGRSDIDLPCARIIAGTSPLHLTAWLDALAYERVYQKADRIEELLKRFCGDWQSAAYVTLARALGFGINGDPFERLALSLPLMFIGKHADNSLAVEALLFGQSGLLDDEKATGDYPARLRREYEFLAHKFGLRKPQGMLWKMSRMRPANFPHRRIAILGAMLANGFRLFDKILAAESLDDAVKLFNPELSPFWSSHYTFAGVPGNRQSALSRSSVTGLTINTVVPLQMAYAQTHGSDEMAEKAIALLQSLPAESNHIVELFRRAGISSPDAYTSQAVIQLRKEYCDRHKCLFCRFGHSLLSSKAIRSPSGLL